MTEDELRIKYFEWLANASPQEKILYDIVLDYHYSYFQDMTLQADSEDSILHDFLCFDSIDENGVINPCYTDLQEKLSSLSDTYLRCYIKKLPNNDSGRYYPQDRIIEISPKYANDQSVILHEMIHAYEYVLSQEDYYYREIIFLCLYRDLFKKIENLDTLILKHAHLWEAEHVRVRGGSHSILFYLKSLDLDFRCGYKLGTVCGYNRTSF